VSPVPTHTLEPERRPRDPAAAVPPPAAEPAPDAAAAEIGGIDVTAIHAPIIREMRDPRDGHEPIPVWAVVFFGGLLFWGGWYLSMYSGGFRADVFDEDPAALYAVAAGPAADNTPPDPVALGRKTFTAYCAACHQASGQGSTGQYPPLAGSEWVNDPRSHKLRRIVLHGFAGPVKVKGSAYNGSMPAFGPRFKDAEVAAVLTFIRQEWGNSAPPVTTEQVAATRAATSGRTSQWTEAELQALSADDPAK
jgi:mono/diheme cytochrome c family protein